MKVADIVARTLYERGASVAWGFPGTDVGPVADALRDADVRWVPMRGDRTAMFAAEASAQLSGGPGVVIGPKARVLAGLSAGFVDRAAVFGWCTDDGAEGLSSRYRPQPADVRSSLRRALAEQRAGRPSPVGFILPYDVSSAEVLDGPEPGEPTAGWVVPDSAVAERIRRWKRPVIVVGFAGRRASVAKLAEELQAPVFTTARAKGAVPEETGLSAGAIGTHAAMDALHRAFLARADGILFIGFDPAEVGSHFRTAFNPDSQVVVIDEFVPVDMPVRIDQLVVGPIHPLVNALVDAFSNGPIRGGASEWRADDAGSHRKRWQSLLEEKGFGVLQAVKAVRFAVGGGDACGLDIPQRGAASHVWRCDRPDRLLQSDGRHSGHGLASALAIVAAGRRGVAVVDERTFQQSLGELATGGDAEMPFVVVVLLDDVRGKSAVDWPKVGAAFGGEGFLVGNAYEVSTAVRDGLYAEEPRLRVVAVKLDTRAERRV